MADPATLTRDELIKLELQGKGEAVAGYDEILWKIRTGYAAVLYGSLTLVSGLGATERWGLSFPRAGTVAYILIIGFTVCAVVLDWSFLRRKLRVIQARDKLMKLGLKMTYDPTLRGYETVNLKKLLCNAGETTKKVKWKGRGAIGSVVILYGVTLLIGLVAIWLMVTRQQVDLTAIDLPL